MSDELLSELVAGGSLEAHGGFSIDKDKAREKMRQFQLPDPRQYVLLLVQAAVQQGATRIDFQIDHDDMEVWFDGDGFSRGDLDELFVSMFGDRRETNLRARQELAVALNAALTLNPRWLRLHSHRDGVGCSLELRPNADAAEAQEASVLARGGTRVHVKQRFRPGLLLQFVRNLHGTLAEEVFLRERARYASVPIFLDGARISTDVRLGAHVGRVDLSGGDLSGACGFSLDRTLEPPRLEVLNAGVWLSTHDLPGFPAGFVAMVDCPGLRKDVSQADVVRDEAYERLVRRLRTALERSLLSLVRLYHADPTDWHRLPSSLRARMPMWIAERVESPHLLRHVGEVQPLYLELPVWQQLDGTWVDTRTLRSRAQVDFISRPDRNPRGHEQAVRAETEGLRAALRMIFGAAVRDRTSAYEQVAARAAQRDKVMSRPWKTTLGEGLYLAREPIQSKVATGEVGLRRNDRESPVIQLVIQGNLLETIVLDAKYLHVPGFVAVVESDFSPRSDWTRARRDEDMARALRAVAEALQRALETAGRTVPEASVPQLALHLAELARVASMEYFDHAFYRAAGFSRQRASRWVNAFGTSAPSDPFSPPRALLTLPLFPGLDGPARSVVQLRADHDEETPLKVLPPAITDKRPMDGYVLADTAMTELLRVFLGEESVVDGGAAYKAARERDAWFDTPTKPFTLMGETVQTVAFESEGIEVKAGMLLAPAGSESSSATVSVRIMVQRRPLQLKLLPFRIPGIVAVVDWPAAPMTPDYSGLREHALLKVARVIDEVSAHLLDTTLGMALNGNHSEPVLACLRLLTFAVFERPGWLAEFQDKYGWRSVSNLAPSFRRLNRRRRGDDPPSATEAASILMEPAAAIEPLLGSLEGLAEAVCRSWANLLDIPMLEAMDGRVSIRAVLQDVERHGTALLMHVSEVPAFEGKTPRIVLVAGNEAQEELWRVFGRESFSSGRAWFDRWQARESFESQPKLALELREADVLVKVDADGELRGEVGIPRAMPTGSGATITACRRRRRVCEVEVAEAGASFVGVLQADSFGVDEEFRALSEADTVRVAAACRAVAPQLAAALAEEWRRFDAAELQLGRAWALALLQLLIGERPLQDRSAKALGEPGLAELHRLPILPHVGGTFWSLEQVLARAVDTPVYVVREGAVPDEALPELVFVRSPEVLLLLSTVLPKVDDLSLVLEVQRQRSANRAAAAVMPSPSVGVVGMVTLDARGVEGALWLDPWLDTSAVGLGDQEKAASFVELSELFVVGGSVHGPAVTIDEMWESAELSKRGKELVQQRARDLYTSLLEGFDPAPETKDEAWERARGLLRGLTERMRDAWASGRKSSDSATRRMYRELRQLPLFELLNGHAASLDQIEKLNAPPEKAPPKRPTTPPKPPKPEPAPVAEPLEPVAPEPEPVAPPTPEAILLDAIRTELRIVGRGSAGMLTNAMLDLVRIGPVPGDVLAEHLDGAVHVRIDHPVTQRALAEPEPAARWVSILASAVFTAFNVGLEEVTDAHEVLFHRMHAQHLAT